MPNPLSDSLLNALTVRRQPRNALLEGPRDQALWDLEEERGWPRWLGHQARGATAGVINPFGLTGWGARGLAHVAPGVLSPETARGFQDTLNRWDRDAPVASTVASFMVPGLGWLRGMVRAGELTRREAQQMLPYIISGGVGVGNMRRVLMGDDEEERRAREYGAAGY